jgi:ketosteroid isomerase-like protein
METSGQRERAMLMGPIRRALADRDLDAYAALYADDATLEEISNLSPPAHPAIVRGREAILEHLRAEILHDPVSGWRRRFEAAKILAAVETGDALAFVEERTYAAGDRAVAHHLAEKRDGRIAHDRLIVVWDPE